MTKDQTKLARAVTTAKNSGLGQKKTAQLLDIGRRTVREILKGNNKYSPQLAQRAVASMKLNRATLMPRKASTRVLPLQLKQLDKEIHRAVQLKCRAWGYEICAVWWNTTAKELEAHVMSRSTIGADFLLANIKVRGIPGFKNEQSFKQQMAESMTQESQA